MDDEMRLTRSQLHDPKYYIEHLLKIKKKSGEISPLIFNRAQQKLYDVVQAQRSQGKPVRVIILKARQLGFSTITEALLYHDSVTHSGVSTLIVAHTEEATSNLFTMSRLFHDLLPPEMQVKKKASNVQELLFENPTRNPTEKALHPGIRSRIRCATAGGQGVGRSATIHNVHMSEFAFWTGDKETTATGIMQAVPDLPGTSVFIESTANGYNEFKNRWDAAVRGESDFIPVFSAWHEDPDYRRPPDPGVVWSDEEIELRRRYSLDDEQLAWRRWCIRNNCAGDKDTFKQEYPSCPDEAFLTSGSSVFDNETVIARRVSSPKPIAQGEFTFEYDGLSITDIKFSERRGGYVSIYVHPIRYKPYVIGGDTAGEGSDFFTGQVLDNTTGQQVATLRHQFDEGIYARQMYCLGQYYNSALIGIETNYSTYPVRELERLKYYGMYVRETLDTYTHKTKKSFGFVTNSVTRPVIIANLVEIMRDTPDLVCDYTTLGEMLTFIYNEQRRPEAMAGEHDDCVMALAIAHHIRSQRSCVSEIPEPVRVEWSDDKWHDYNNASEDVRKYLIEKWGHPK